MAEEVKGRTYSQEPEVGDLGNGFLSLLEDWGLLLLQLPHSPGLFEVELVHQSLHLLVQLIKLGNVGCHLGFLLLLCIKIKGDSGGRSAGW